MPPVVFSHGNSFPASTYRVVLDSLRDRGFEVDAIEKFGHDPKYPVTDNWPHLVQQLADFAQQHAGRAGRPVFLVGHSLGGILSLMCAALHPQLACGVVLLDSPILSGWRANTLNVVKRTPLMKSVSPGAISHRRRNSWAHREAVFEHFRSKKAFAKWDEQVLHDYIDHGTFEGENTRELSFDRNVETAIYNTLPHNLGALLRRHPPKCKVAFIGGRQSVEMRQVGMAMTEQVTKGRIAMLDGGHLFPMEKPLATAAAIEAALRNLL
ncbi:putative hydrolase or acyltransferase of alpha/beta superfamily [Variovorax sp. CF313]|uniref:alpha/beta fold hydrolase n=1 Tax=Variovorax sp. CF313 TaxID=1144315 RepID=UPI0002711166|nr:alpha/beta hydrolase [Variovorax sp. CF313]EJL74542.1 putative hydrolase or acyltransferase of alpha/beta superfamily [Variovorax sp. CF313]